MTDQQRMWKERRSEPHDAAGLLAGSSSDCEQLVLALIVNQDGFPFSYELFDGNRADVPPAKRFFAPWNGNMGKHGGSGSLIVVW